MGSSLTIQSITVSPLQAPLLQPFRIAVGQHDTLDNVLVTLTLANGVKGYGEAAVATHITGETIPQTVQHLKSANRFLKGQDASDYLAISAQLHEAWPHNACAIAAVEMAIFDAMTRHLRMPLWRLWGHRPSQLNTDITIVIGDLNETAAKTKDFYRRGFRSFKIKVGRDMDLDIKRVLAVHAIARKSQIILDANQGYCAREALQLLKSLAKAGIVPHLIEQPVPKNDWDGLKQVTRSTKVCVCADESVSSLPQTIRAIKEKAVGAINIKLMKTGIVQSVAISRWAKANGLKLMIGGMMESNLAMTASAHLATGLGCFDFIDLDTPFFIKGAVDQNPWLSAKGVYDLSKVKAGIGIKP